MKKRKMTAILLAVLLGFTVTTPSFASYYIDVDEVNPHKEAIEEMSSLGILEGTGNYRFNPDGQLNRAAAAKVAAFLLGYKEADAAAAARWEPMFGDVYAGMGAHEWALGWINLVARDEVIKGFPSGNYGPGEPLQMVQWTAILLRILQHETPGMSWPAAYNEQAIVLGLDSQLTYAGSEIVNRAQMSRMTHTVLYEVKRADGDLLIDVVPFERRELETPEEREYENTTISLEVIEPVVATGGGKIVTVMATVTFGPENHPAINTPVEFFAQVGNMNRRDQLSKILVVTDAAGKASSQLTTLAADNNKQIEFLANARSGDDWVDSIAYALISDAASLISGRVVNPFTGVAVMDAEVGLSDPQGGYQKVAITQNGTFSTAVGTGSYHMNIRMNVDGDVPFSGAFLGSGFELLADGSLFYSDPVTVRTNQAQQLQTAQGILTGRVTNMSSGTELYALQIGSGKTFLLKINESGRVLRTLPPGRYEFGTMSGQILRNGVVIEAGKVTDMGAITR